MIKFAEKYQKFRKSYVGLLILTIVSVLAGLGLFLSPETTPKFIIQGVGLIWLLEGGAYGGSLLVKYLEDRIKSKTGNHGG